MLKRGEMLIANPFNFEVIKEKDYGTKKLHPFHVVLTTYKQEQEYRKLLRSIGSRKFKRMQEKMGKACAKAIDEIAKEALQKKSC